MQTITVLHLQILLSSVYEIINPLTITLDSSDALSPTGRERDVADEKSSRTTAATLHLMATVVDRPTTGRGVGMNLSSYRDTEGRCSLEKVMS